jgi:ribonuclease HII
MNKTGHNRVYQHKEKNFFEKSAWKANKEIIGIDEVGRGSLAGPVVVCALILKSDSFNKQIKDSKLMTALDRQKAYEWLCNNSIFVITSISQKLIDKKNIYQATLFGMNKACTLLFSKIKFLKKISHILVDAMPLKLLRKDSPTIEFFTKGETHSVSIAAASIVAKVTRDRLMKKYESHFPSFSFGTHKGYGTPAHKSEIIENHFEIKQKISLIHRKTFIKNICKTDEQKKNLRSKDAIQQRCF